MSDKAERLIERMAEDGEEDFVVAYAILKLRDEVARVAWALRQIGTGDTSGPGALEFIGMQLRDGIRVVRDDE